MAPKLSTKIIKDFEAAMSAPLYIPTPPLTITPLLFLFNFPFLSYRPFHLILFLPFPTISTPVVGTSPVPITLTLPSPPCEAGVHVSSLRGAS